MATTYPLTAKLASCPPDGRLRDVNHPMTVSLSPSQQRVIDHRATHLQVIACAGSGKTEAISRRVAGLVAEGVEPRAMVAFTFTEKAAAELKTRVIARVREAMGEDFLGRLGPLFIGTIHGYAFRILQDHVPEYGNHDILDEHRQAGLLSREFESLGLSQLGSGHWRPIRDFIRNADAVGNELIDSTALGGTAFGNAFRAYEEVLDRFHLLTFQLIISRAVRALQDPLIFQRVHGHLRHLLVDEYQDVNPAQERLIHLLATDPVELCVVADDDQAIYEWRGSDVRNILTFRQRYPQAASVELDTNRRSRPTIIATANAFVERISDRLPKAMKPYRPPHQNEVVCWSAPTEEGEAEVIADTIGRLRDAGYKLRDIGVLYRSVRTSAPPLVDALGARAIPFSCGGRTGLFLQPEIALFGEIFSWLGDGSWREHRFGEIREVGLESVVSGLCRLFPDAPSEHVLAKYLEDWKVFRLRGIRPVSLVGDYYRLLSTLGVSSTDTETPLGSARFGAFARFSEVLADFEHVTRRARLVDDAGKRVFRSGRDRGKPFLRALANYLLHYAQEAYEDFDGEGTHDLDAVSVMTVHQAKGLEWPVVFLPALVEGRFPSRMAGQEHSWLLPDEVFPPAKQARYAGSDDEERRLFYVALTRARDCVYLSRFERRNNQFQPSPFLLEVAGGLPGSAALLPRPAPPEKGRVDEAPALALAFSDVALFEECGYRYRLAGVFGYEQELAVELGYGRAIHHVLRRVAEWTRETGAIPGPEKLDGLLEAELYLPFADAPAFQRMEKATRRVVSRYVAHYASDLLRVWAVERPFELNLQDGVVAGRADVILDEEGGVRGRLAIVDYKVAEDPTRDARYRRQLTVYAAAARGEGLNVEAAYLHELGNGLRQNVAVGADEVTAAVASLNHALASIRRGEYPPDPSADKCARCDFRPVCRYEAS